MRQRLIATCIGSVLVLFLGAARNLDATVMGDGVRREVSILRTEHDNSVNRFGALLPGSLARGKGVFKKSCKSCHASAVRFKKYKKSKINNAIKTQPTMVGIKLSPQKMLDLVTYFAKIK